MDILNTSLYLRNKLHGDVKYRVPLSTIVEYKGFRCLVTSLPLIGPDTLIFGPSKNQIFHHSDRVAAELKEVAKLINVKSHEVDFEKDFSLKIPLSSYCEVHKVEFPDHEQLKQDVKIKEVERGLRPTFSTKINPECYYILKTENIFPIDVDFEAKGSLSFYKKLR